jgi:hypothetical protein
MRRNNARFAELLRSNYNILGPMAAPGIDLVNTRWPVVVKSPTASGGRPDFADVVYSVHRCCHGHGDELPAGFKLIGDARGPARMTRMVCEKGAVRLSDRTIFGLMAVAVMNPVNIGQRVPDGYYLTYSNEKFMINEWWGRAAEFPSLVAIELLPNVVLDWGEWMP